jgi:predicted ATPase
MFLRRSTPGSPKASIHRFCKTLRRCLTREVTRLLLERGDQGGIYAIPPTLQQSLTARLDRLGSAREVAQIGAVIGRDFTYFSLRTVAGMEDALLQMALERLTEADILLVQGLPPDAEYRFKHALIQDAAYENLLKSKRQFLHRRVAETLRDLAATTEPELLAHHFSQAGLTAAAIEWWGKSGQRSLERSALVEAVEQFKRALDLIATLTGTPALRRERITLQVGLASALMPTKGHAAPETRAAFEQARLLIERAEALGEPQEDPLLLFSVLYGFYVASWSAFNGDLVRELAVQFLALAEKQAATGPLMIGHRQMGAALTYTGDIAGGQAHFDQAFALYDPAEHRSLATRFGQDVLVTILFQRSLSRWLLGHAGGAREDVADAIRDARKIGHAATLTYALLFTWFSQVFCGNYSAAAAQADEIIALADQKNSTLWRACGTALQGSVVALTGRALDGVKMITTGISALHSVELTLWMPFWLSQLARAQSELGQFGEARRRVGEAIAVVEATKEVWYEAELYRTAGEIELASSEHDAARARTYFECAISVARQQQAKSWELRAAMSMARLWRDQGKRDEARDLLAPVYGWFTEGFDTRDLKEAKA